MSLTQLYAQYKEERLSGRYITNSHIEPLLKTLSSHFNVAIEGYSVRNNPVYSLTAGSGDKRIFMWSQMHGNESTTTKAVFDFLNWLKSEDAKAAAYRNFFTFYIIPIANPDGALLYTRENANNVDLNRDAYNRTQPESIILRAAFEKFEPHYCYNMHDQRTIFGLRSQLGVKAATVSFLAPAYNEEREMNGSRQDAVNVIAAMNDTLQQFIPGQVGRFDDSFNINCIGDSFQAAGVPTILFEAGHYPEDYEREISRKFIFFAIISGFASIYENVIAVNRSSDYFNIPQNEKIFYDFVYKNVKINYENKEFITIFAAQYKEVLINNSVMFHAFINKIDNCDDCVGHVEYNGNNAQFTGVDGEVYPVEGKKADFSLLPGRIFRNGREVANI